MDVFKRKLRLVVKDERSSTEIDEALIVLVFFFLLQQTW
jgi:hypothetical protein